MPCGVINVCAYAESMRRVAAVAAPLLVPLAFAVFLCFLFFLFVAWSFLCIRIVV